MAGKRKPELRESDISGAKYLRAFEELLSPLMDVPVHGNRDYQFHHHVGLLLLYFFTPVLTSLRALQQATGLQRVQRILGIKRTSLSAMSASANHIFDPAALRPILEHVSAQIQKLARPDQFRHLPGELTAVDGSLLRCLPRMVWALFRRKTQHRAARLHMQYSIERNAPSQFELTQLTTGEAKQLTDTVQPGKLYLLDRGFICYKMYQAIHDAGSFFVSRLKDNSSYEVIEDLPLTAEDKEANVICDQRVRMGSAFTDGDLTTLVRRVVVQEEGRNPVILLTNTDLSAEVVGQMYRYRWQVELFFRWFKCVLGCTHWVSESLDGMTIQVYVALLASMLITLWTGRKPTKRTFEMLCLYFQGWATAEELTNHIASLKKQN